MERTFAELVDRARRKDGAAFAELIRLHERTMLGVAYAILGNAAAAADATQDAFFKAWNRLADLREPERFRQWMLGIVRNVALDQRRKIRPHGEIETAPPRPDTRDGPAQQAENREMEYRIQQALDQLDETTRLAVVMRYYESMDSAEIGKLLELTPSAVDMRLSRARQQLKGILADAGTYE